MRKQGDAMDEEDDGPRRSFTGRGRFRPSRAKLQGGVDENGVQQGGDERTATDIDGRRGIRRVLPSAEAEQAWLWQDMAAAAKIFEGENGNPSSGGSLWRRL